MAIPRKRVLILGRTRTKTGLCIGGLTSELEPIRLKTSVGGFWPRDNCAFNIGEWHEVEYTRITDLENPHHTEDVQVKDHELDCVINMTEIIKFLEGNNLVRNGAVPSAAFKYSGKISPFEVSYNNVFRIGRSKLSELLESTTFWKSSYNMEFDGARYKRENLLTKIKYVGDTKPIQKIPSGTVVRLSTSTVWEQWGYAYMQLSGWFM